MDAHKLPGSQRIDSSAERAKLEVHYRSRDISHRAVVVKTGWYWYKNKHIDQWNQTEGSNMSVVNIWQTFQQCMPAERKLPWTVLGRLDGRRKRGEIRSISITLLKNQSGVCQSSHRAGPKSLKLMEENVGRSLQGAGGRKGFQNGSSFSQSVRPDQWKKCDFINLEGSVHQRKHSIDSIA